MEGKGTVGLYVNGNSVSSNTSSFSFKTVVSLDVELKASSSGTWAFAYWIVNGSEGSSSTLAQKFTVNTELFVRFLNEAPGHGGDKQITTEVKRLPSDSDGGSVEWSYVDGGVTIVRNSQGYAPKNAVITFTASADPDHRFLYWSGDVSEMATTTSSSSAEDIHAIAYFASDADTVTVTVTSEGSGSVLVSIKNGPSFTYTRPFNVSVNDVVTKTASPSTGWTFSHWLGEDGVKDNSVTKEFRFSDHTTVHAVFSMNGSKLSDWELPIILILGNILLVLVAKAFKWIIFGRDDDEEEEEERM